MYYPELDIHEVGEQCDGLFDLDLDHCDITDHDLDLYCGIDWCLVQDSDRDFDLEYVDEPGWSMVLDESDVDQDDDLDHDLDAGVYMILFYDLEYNHHYIYKSTFVCTL